MFIQVRARNGWVICQHVQALVWLLQLSLPLWSSCYERFPSFLGLAVSQLQGRIPWVTQRSLVILQTWYYGLWRAVEHNCPYLTAYLIAEALALLPSLSDQLLFANRAAQESRISRGVEIKKRKGGGGKKISSTRAPWLMNVLMYLDTWLVRRE